MANAMIGATHFENPPGSPRLRSVMAVDSGARLSQVYVVSIGKGPSAVRITSRCRATKSTISYVYASRRPRKCATNAIRDPTASGGGVFHSTDLMLMYHSGAFAGSAA